LLSVLLTVNQGTIALAPLSQIQAFLFAKATVAMLVLRRLHLLHPDAAPVGLVFTS
jgi:hypothetical protein